jgi:hypothetical protein
MAAMAAVHPFVKTVRSRFGFTVEEESRLRYLVVASATLSLFGASVIIYSAIRFKELAKRFFAIRLIFFLSVTDLLASVFNVLGAFVNVHTVLITETSALCYAQALGLLYFNLASIMWTSCFAFTLYRDVVPSYRRFALRKYEVYFHSLCWTLPGALSLVCWHLKLLGDAGASDRPSRRSDRRRYLSRLALVAPLRGGASVRGAGSAAHAPFHRPPSLGSRRRASRARALPCSALARRAGSWCAIRSSHAREYLIAFYLPLVLAFGFNVGTYALVCWGSSERRVTRTTSLYLLAFAFVWLPSLTKAIKVYFFDMHAGFVLAAAEAICMPLQGALNAAVYGWSLPSIRDFYKSMFLGYESLDARRRPALSRSSSRSPISHGYDEEEAPIGEIVATDRPAAYRGGGGGEVAEGADERAADPDSKMAPLLAGARGAAAPRG